MLWVENRMRIAPWSMPRSTNSATAERTPSTKGSTNPGWSKNWRTLSICMRSPSPVCSSASAKSSRYWRQLEYELYALVARPISRVKPRSAASSSASLR